MGTIDKVELLLGITDDSLQYLRTIHTHKMANEAIICVLIRLMESDTDTLAFCDNMEKVVKDITAVQYIVSLRNGTIMVIVLSWVTYVLEQNNVHIL